MGWSSALQKAIFDILIADPGVSAIVGDRVYDAMPSDGEYPSVSFGPSDIVPADEECITSSVETIQLDCWSQDQGRLNPCKDLVAAVKAALHDVPFEMVEPYARMTGYMQLAQTFLDPDGKTAHGVIQIAFRVQESVDG